MMPTHSIYNVKQSLSQQRELPLGHLQLSFNGNVLDDESTLSNSGIRNEDVLKLQVQEHDLNIFVRYPNGEAKETISLKVKQTNSIEQIKAMIEVEKGIPAGSQRLIIYEQELEDMHTVQFYQLEEEANLLLQIIEEEFKVLINMPKQNTIELWVKPSYTIQNVKTKIEGQEGILTYQQLLDLNGRKYLKDKRTHKYYNIQYGETLNLTLLKKAIKIFVNWQNFITMKFERMPYDTVEKVKLLIQEEQNIPI